MWALLDDDGFVIDVVKEDPKGRFHESIHFAEVPTWLRPYINTSFWYINGKFDNDLGYSGVLDIAKARLRERFDVAFKEIDERRARPTAAVAEANATLLIPSAPEQTPITPLAADPALRADLNILGQLNMVAEENRRFLNSVLDEKITSNTSEQRAIDIIEFVTSARPWIPWKLEPEPTRD